MTPGCHYVNIELDGWRGLVLINSRPSARNRLEMENADPWRAWLTMLVQNVQKLPEAKVLKTSDTVEVLEAQFPRNADERPLHVVCKHTKSRGIKDAITGFARTSAARRAFGRALLVQTAGIETAQPLAYLERKFPRTSWLITEYLEGVVDLDAYVLTCLSRVETRGDRARRNAIVHALVDLYQGFKSADLYHRDMKASNILLANTQGDSPRACIVDLDGLEPTRLWRSEWKPIVRLAASLLQYPAVTRTDYARFLRDYLIAGGEDRRAWQTHFLRLRKQAARYAQAAHKRKSNKLEGFTGDAVLRSA